MVDQNFGLVREVRDLTVVRGTAPLEFRDVAANLRFEHHSYRTAIQGLDPRGTLRLLLNADLEPIA